jgi:hypothetical protein
MAGDGGGSRQRLRKPIDATGEGLVGDEQALVFFFEFKMAVE